MSTDRLNHADPDGLNAPVEIGAVPIENFPGGKVPAEKTPGDKESSDVVGASDREDAAWRELEADELRSSEIDAIADYLRESGQASA